MVVTHTLRRDGGVGSGQVDLVSTVVDQVRTAPFGLVPSLTWLKALVVLRGGWMPDDVDDEVWFSRQWKDTFRSKLSPRPSRDPSSGRFPLRLDSGIPELTTWGLGRVSGLEGWPIVIGDSERWAHVGVDQVRGLLRAHLGTRTPRWRAEALEFEIDRVLGSRGIPVRRGEETYESDRVALVDGVPINLELRNFRDEIHPGLDADDRRTFRARFQEGMPSVVVTSAPSQHLHRDVVEDTEGVGVAFGTGVYVTGPVTSEESEALAAMDPPLRPEQCLPDEVADRLVVELELVASRWRARGSNMVAFPRGLPTDDVLPHELENRGELAPVSALPEKGRGRLEVARRRAEEACAMVAKSPFLARQQPEVARRMAISVTTLQRAFRVAEVESPFVVGNVRGSE